MYYFNKIQFRLLLLAFFAIIIFSGSASSVPPGLLQNILSDPDKTYDEKKQAYYAFVVEQNPQMAALLDNPGMKATMDKTFQSMLNNMAFMQGLNQGNTSKEPKNVANFKNMKADQLESMKQLQVDKKQLAIAKKEAKAKEVNALNNVKIRGLDRWPLFGVSTQARSIYSIKDIKIGSQVIESAKNLINDKGFSIKGSLSSLKGGGNISLTKNSQLGDGIVLTESIRLITNRKLSDIVTNVKYNFGSRSINSRSGVSIESLSLNVMKKKLENKYGPPLTYDLIMKPSIIAAKKVLYGSFNTTQCNRLSNSLNSLLSKPNGKINHKKCLKSLKKSQKEDLLKALKSFEQNVAQHKIPYNHCVDKKYDLEKYGSCLPLSIVKVGKATDGTAIINGNNKVVDTTRKVNIKGGNCSNCYAWVKNGDSLLLHVGDYGGSISISSVNISTWVSNTVEKGFSNDKIKVDLDL